MKRGGYIQRKTELARSPFKKKSKRKKSPRILMKDKAWKAFSRYIRLRDALKTTGTPDRCICVTCGQEKPAFGKGCIHAGHWLGGRAGKNLFAEHACAGQCYGCNVNEHGKSAAYQAYMVKEYGWNEMDRLTLQANTPYTYSLDEFEAIKDKYERMYEDLA